MDGSRVRAPRYLERFRCIGSACEDHCCGGWQNVDVDVESYARLNRVDHPTLSPILRERLIPNLEETARADDFALIRVPKGGNCPLLTAERLCAIQGALGETLLPVACDTFPRQANRVDGTTEVAGRLACPEVARLALLAADALEPLEPAPDRRLNERGRYWVEKPWRDDLPEHDLRRHYHRLREHCLALLRRRDKPLETRLQALGLALAALSGQSAAGLVELEQAFELARQRLDVSLLPGPSRLAGSQLRELSLARVRTWLDLPDLPPRYRVCLKRIRDGLRLPVDPAASLDAAVEQAYTEGSAGLDAYLRQRPWLFENLLANQLWVGNFPFHPRRSLLEEYALLVSRYRLLELHLVGAAATEGELSDQVVVETIQAFDKYADSPDYWDRTLPLLSAADLLDPGALLS